MEKKAETREEWMFKLNFYRNWRGRYLTLDLLKDNEPLEVVEILKKEKEAEIYPERLKDIDEEIHYLKIYDRILTKYNYSKK